MGTKVLPSQNDRQTTIGFHDGRRRLPELQQYRWRIIVSIIGYLIGLIVLGFVIGGLSRLIVPGPNRIGLWATFGVGLSGALAGGLLGGLLGLGVFSLVFEIVISAGLVYLVSRHSGRVSLGGRR
jgi:uncharacterized membrane protein YeaQ/YmgE (transglycosylase-associated protein family)